MLLNTPSELVRLKAATQEPLLLADAKLFLRVETDDEDDLIQGFCSGARIYAEKFCRRSFVTGEQWKLSLDRFPFAALNGNFYATPALTELFNTPGMYLFGLPEHFSITLPQSPVLSVDSIQYLDASGNPQTLASSGFTLVHDDDGDARLYPAYETSWPATINYPQAVQITYTTGSPPEQLVIVAMLQMIAHWYANREAVIMSPGVTPQKVPLAAEMLLWPYRNLEF